MKFFILPLDFRFLQSAIFIFIIFKFALSQNCEAPKINHDFGNFDNVFFQSALKDGKKNIKEELGEDNFSFVVSPFYLKVLLSIISIGATNASLNELNGILNIPCCKQDVAKLISQQMSYSVWDSDTKVDAFHMLFVDQKIHLKPSFKSLLTKLNVTIDYVNYDMLWTAQTTINKLIKGRSKTFISEMFDIDDVINVSDNIAIFSNAYFKGKWLTPPTILNDTQNFYVNNDEKIKMGMFRITQEMRYSNIKEIDAQVVDIPYSNCSLSMMIFVPNSKNGLNYLEEKLLSHNDLLDYVDKFLTYKPVAVTLPKYYLESLILLPNKLKEMGVTKIFSEGAELGQMMDYENSAYISFAIQRIMVWVTEGRKAFKDTGDPEYPIPEKFIVADRPYFFIIRSNKSILFMGHFYK